jgi:hypothetical protein
MITNSQSGTNVHEIADGIYRINTPVSTPGAREPFFCGDLFTQGGSGKIALTESDSRSWKRTRTASANSKNGRSSSTKESIGAQESGAEARVCRPARLCPE